MRPQAVEYDVHVRFSRLCDHQWSQLLLVGNDRSRKAGFGYFATLPSSALAIASNERSPAALRAAERGTLGSESEVVDRAGAMGEAKGPCWLQELHPEWGELGRHGSDVNSYSHE